MSRKTILVRSQDIISVAMPGLARDDVLWAKDGVPINASTERYQVLANGSLQIFDTRKSDGGRYTVAVPKLDLAPANIIRITVRGTCYFC